jgi:hypothetical protein
MSEEGEYTGKFSCVYCGQDVNFDAEKHKLVCSNAKCPEGDSSYGFNPLRGCVWAELVAGKYWVSVSKRYILANLVKFVKGRR